MKEMKDKKIINALGFEAGRAPAEPPGKKGLGKMSELYPHPGQ